MKTLKWLNSLQLLARMSGDPTGGGTPGPGVEGGVQNDGGVTVGLDMNMGGAASSDSPKFDWNTALSDDLKAKPYFEQILKSSDPTAEFIKQFDNAQQLIGRKPADVPAADAPDEAWEEFGKKLRPEKADDYATPEVEWSEEEAPLKAQYEKYRDPDMIKGMKEIAYKHGIPKRQFDAAFKEIMSLEAAKTKEYYAQKVAEEKALEDGFEETYKKWFGGDKLKAEEAAEAFIKEFVPENLKQFTTTVDNNTAALLGALAMGVNAKYETQDTLSNPGDPKTGSDTLESIDAEMMRLMTLPEYESSFHPNSENVRKQVEELSKKKVALLKAAR